MTYDDLIANLSDRTGLRTEDIKRVLYHLPDALGELKPKEKVWTPLGHFRKVRSEARKVLLPDRTTEVDVPAKSFVKLKPNSRLTEVHEAS
jgi:nucleoid DNA-binding protein